MKNKNIFETEKKNTYFVKRENKILSTRVNEIKGIWDMLCLQ